MTEAWIVIRDGAGERRERLKEGLTRLGGAGADVLVEGAGEDQLHVWDDPARVVFVGAGPKPRGPAGVFEELRLSSGTELAWGGVRLRYEEERPAPLEEIPLESSEGRLSAEELAAWRRVRAGLLVEQGLADRVTVRSWQQAVRERRFRADECADELLARSPVAPDDPRVMQRTGVLLRDLLMAPLARGARGAGRKAKRAAQGGLAFALAQGTAFLVFCLIVLGVALVLRLKGHSLDGWIDRLLLREPG